METSPSLRTRLLDAVDADDDDNVVDISMGGMHESSITISSSSAINRASEPFSDEPGQPPSKTIGFLYSFCLHLNNLTGPALVLLPLINQEAGWLPCTLGLFLLAFFSFLASSMLAEAIQRIPGIDPAASSLGILANNCHQISDVLLVRLFGHSWGVSFSSGVVRGYGMHVVFEATPGPVLSAGLAISVVLCAPFALVRLEQSMKFQLISALLCFCIALVFVVQFILNMSPISFWHIDGAGPSLTPMFNAPGLLRVAGLCSFEFSYASFVPAWLIRKRVDVSVSKALALPASLSFVLKLIFGILGAWAFPLYVNNAPLPGSNNILNFLSSPGMPSLVQACVYLWVLACVLPRIPTLCIVLRSSLAASELRFGIVSQAILAIALPWIVAAVITPTYLAAFCNWTAVTIQGITNFAMPMLLYRAALARGIVMDGDDHSQASAHMRRHMEAVAAAEALLLGKRALRRRPKDLDSISLSSSLAGKEAQVEALPAYLGLNQMRIVTGSLVFVLVVYLFTLVANVVSESCSSSDVAAGKAFCAAL